MASAAARFLEPPESAHGRSTLMSNDEGYVTLSLVSFRKEALHSSQSALVTHPIEVIIFHLYISTYEVNVAKYRLIITTVRDNPPTASPLPANAQST